MHRVTAFFAFLLLSTTFAAPALAAEETRSQHRNWMLKLETPGGTHLESFETLMQPDGSQGLISNGTAVQHRSWIRKLEALDSNAALPL